MGLRRDSQSSCRRRALASDRWRERAPESTIHRLAHVSPGAHSSAPVVVRDMARGPHGHVPLKGSQVQTCQTQVQAPSTHHTAPRGAGSAQSREAVGEPGTGRPDLQPRGGGRVLAPHSRLCSACDSQLPGHGQAFIFQSLSFSTRRHGNRNSHLDISRVQ